MGTFIDNFKTVLADKGWLAISSLYFDNSSICNIYNTGGYVTLCEATNSVYWMSVLDSTDTSICENIYVSMDPFRIGQQVTLIQQDLDCLQNVAYAMYAHRRFFSVDDDKEIPYPTIPTEAELEALELVESEAFGPHDRVYGDSDGLVVEWHDRTKHQEHKDSSLYMSAIPLYKDFDPTLAELDSAAIVDSWKTFYANHKKFITMIEAYFGASGCV